MKVETMKDNLQHRDENNTQSIVVLPVQVAFEGLRLQDGRVLSIAVDEPKTAFIVAMRNGDDINLASRHETAEEATAEAKRLITELEQMAAGQAGKLN